MIGSDTKPVYRRTVLPEPKPDSPVKAAGSLKTTDAEVPKSNTKTVFFDDDKHSAFRNNRAFLND
jgi:hypothetical protein